MMEKMKHFRLKWILRMGFCLALIAAMVLIGAVMASAEVYSGECGAQGDNVTWTLDTETGVLEISGKGEMVRSNQQWEKYSSLIKKVILHEGIDKMGSGAFRSCENLTQVSLPSTLTEISESAFEYCYNLTDVYIPSSVTIINDWAFHACTGMERIVFPNDSKLTYIDVHAFHSCNRLLEIHIPASVENIGFRAFSDCSKLEKVNFSDNSQLKVIGTAAFQNCDSLISFEIPSSVEVIEEYAFNYCDNLKFVYIPSNSLITSIGDNAFYFCNNLESIEIQNAHMMKQLGRFVFGYTNIEHITIPENLFYIGEAAFQECKALKSLVFTNTDGWFISASSTATMGTIIDVSNASNNALNMTSIYAYCNYYLHCVEKYYTITFMANGEIVATVPYWNTNHNIEIPAVPHKPGYTGVWEDFDLTNGGDITVHAIYTPTESKLTGASVSLGQSLALNYYATLNPAHTAAQMRFTYHGETTLVSGALDEASGEYKFTFGRIPPQCMGDNVKAELILISEDGTETVLDVKESYSIREYCDDALAANPNNKTLATLLADLLAYGDAAQDYANYNEDTPVSEGFEVAPSEWEDVTDTDFTLSDKTREELCFTAAGVRFGYVNRVYFKIKAADLTGVTLTVNGKTYTADDLTLAEDTADTYIFYTDAVYATEFDKVFTAELSVDGEVIQVVTYSVKSYVCAKQNSNDTEIAALVKALYNYGRSAIAYKNAQ